MGGQRPEPQPHTAPRLLDRADSPELLSLAQRGCPTSWPSLSCCRPASDPPPPLAGRHSDPGGGEPCPLAGRVPRAPWHPPAPQDPLTQAAGAEAAVCPRLRLGLVAVEDLLHQLLHREARAAVPIAAGPLDAVDCGREAGRSGAGAVGRAAPRPTLSSAPSLLGARQGSVRREAGGPGCPPPRPAALGSSVLSLPSLGCRLGGGPPGDSLLSSPGPSAPGRLVKGSWSGGEGARTGEER